MADFELPDSLKGITADSLHQEMLDLLPDDIDKTEGGFAWDFTRPAANIAAELINYHVPIILMSMFPQWAQGIYLDYLADVMHIYRRQATKAVVTVTVTGTMGTVIPAGTIFSTASTNENSGYKFETSERVMIGSEETVDVQATAIEGGSAYNVLPGTIVLCTSSLSGISGVTNLTAASGGADEETDTLLRARLLSSNAERDISYIGNNADYRRWAMEVNGVGYAYVTAEYDGPGTVGITITDTSGSAPTEALAQAVYDHIMAPDNPYDRLAPPGVILHVIPVTTCQVAYRAIVKIRDGLTIQLIKDAFQEALEPYYDEAVDNGYLRLHKVGAILSSISGVIDYWDLTMNGEEANIPLTGHMRPITSSITLIAGGE